MEPVYRACEVVARSMFRVQGLRFTMTGLQHIPSAGGAVLAINHTAYTDPLYAGLAARRAERWLRFMTKIEVFQHPLGGFVARHARQIPVDRSQGAQSYDLAVQALRDGELVGVYPEATISRSFELKTFKRGAARMALEAQVPLVPMIIWGAQRVWTKGQPRRLGRTSTPITVAVGEPIMPSGTADELTWLLFERMNDLLHAVQEGYGPHPPGAAWIPQRLGGGAPSLAEANRMDAADLEARRARRGPDL